MDPFMIGCLVKTKLNSLSPNLEFMVEIPGILIIYIFFVKTPHFCKGEVRIYLHTSLNGVLNTNKLFATILSKAPWEAGIEEQLLDCFYFT